jgi:hypoxanthine phosphoribosyltransferase
MNDEINKTDLNREHLSWNDIENLVKVIGNKIKEKNEKYDSVIGIKNGGIIPARLISKELEINEIEFISINPDQSNKFYYRIKNDKKYLLIDEIYDTGKTFLTVKDYLKNIEYNFACLISRYTIQDDKIIIGKILNNEKWIVFPWE